MPVIKPGSRLRSAVSPAEFIVTKAPAGDVELTCGGLPLLPMDSQEGNTGAGAEGSVVMGKRYVNADASIEVLCTKPGVGTLALNEETLEIRASNALPSSD